VWRTVAAPAAILGLVCFVAFVFVSFAAHQVSALSSALESVLGKADAGPRALALVVAVVNGAAEELFFRGAVHAAFEPRHPALLSTLVYVAVTAATGNVALIAAAAVMGAVFSLERMSTRGVLAPAITHVTWSTLMLLALPR
jgi:membrane protease YdiL (CAAX protease family)